jgi:DNA-binding LacI/PurR family transcriptional regulator
MDHRPWTDLVLEFAPLGKPMALLDETGEYTVPRIPGAERQLRHYTMGFSAEAGRRMGAYLLGLGHRRFAYISPVHRAAWSRNRLAGLREACAHSGTGASVVEHILDEHSLPHDFLLQSAHVRTQLLGRIGTVAARARESLLGRATTALRLDLDSHLMREAYALAMVPLMEAAARDESVSAWVAADDDTAMPCLAFLRERGIGVPERVSVVGFDDGVGSSLQKLTSYNYNGAAYMRAMLAHVLSPGSPESGGSRHSAIELGGTVVERKTAGPAQRTSVSRPR